MLRAAVVLTVVTAAACLSGCGGEPAQRSSAAGSRAGGDAAASTVAYSPACGVVSGGLPHDYKSKSLVIGPIALYRAREWASYPARYMTTEREGFRRALQGERRPHERRRLRRLIRRASREPYARYPPFETALTVDAGHRATLTIVGASRQHFAWLFDPRAWVNASRGYRVADGERTIHVTSCKRPYSQYQGGFVVDGPRCVAIDVAVDGARPVRRRFAVGSTASCADRGGS